MVRNTLMMVGVIMVGVLMATAPCALYAQADSSRTIAIAIHSAKLVDGIVHVEYATIDDLGRPNTTHEKDEFQPMDLSRLSVWERSCAPPSTPFACTVEFLVDRTASTSRSWCTPGGATVNDDIRNACTAFLATVPAATMQWSLWTFDETGQATQRRARATGVADAASVIGGIVCSTQPDTLGDITGIIEAAIRRAGTGLGRKAVVVAMDAILNHPVDTDRLIGLATTLDVSVHIFIPQNVAPSTLRCVADDTRGFALDGMGAGRIPSMMQGLAEYLYRHTACSARFALEPRNFRKDLVVSVRHHWERKLRSIEIPDSIPYDIRVSTPAVRTYGLPQGETYHDSIGVVLTGMLDKDSVAVTTQLGNVILREQKIELVRNRTVWLHFSVVGNGRFQQDVIRVGFLAATVVSCGDTTGIPFEGPVTVGIRGNPNVGDTILVEWAGLASGAVRIIQRSDDDGSTWRTLDAGTGSSPYVAGTVTRQDYGRHCRYRVLHHDSTGGRALVPLACNALRNSYQETYNNRAHYWSIDGDTIFVVEDDITAYDPNDGHIYWQRRFLPDLSCNAQLTNDSRDLVAATSMRVRAYRSSADGSITMYVPPVEWLEPMEMVLSSSDSWAERSNWNQTHCATLVGARSLLSFRSQGVLFDGALPVDTVFHTPFDSRPGRGIVDATLVQLDPTGSYLAAYTTSSTKMEVFDVRTVGSGVRPLLLSVDNLVTTNNSTWRWHSTRPLLYTSMTAKALTEYDIAANTSRVLFDGSPLLWSPPVFPFTGDALWFTADHYDTLTLYDLATGTAKRKLPYTDKTFRYVYGKFDRQDTALLVTTGTVMNAYSGAVQFADAIATSYTLFVTTINPSPAGSRSVVHRPRGLAVRNEHVRRWVRMGSSEEVTFGAFDFAVVDSVRMDEVVCSGTRDTFVVVRNAGYDTLRIRKASIADVPSGSVSFGTSPIGMAVLPKDSLVLPLTIRYDAVSTVSADVSLQADGPGNVPHTVHLVAPFTPVVHTLDAMEFDLGERPMADTTITVRSRSTVPTLITSVVSTDPRCNVVTLPPLDLIPGGTADVRVRFSRTDTGTFTSMFVLTSDPCGSHDTVYVTWRARYPLPADSIVLALDTVRTTTASVAEVHWRRVWPRPGAGIDLPDTLVLHVTGAVNATVLRPLCNGTDDGDAAEIVIAPGDTIGTFCTYVTAVGSDSVSSVTVPFVRIVRGARIVSVLPGRVVLTDLCVQGGLRRIDAMNRFSVSVPVPNPASSSVHIVTRNITDGVLSVSLSSALGHTVYHDEHRGAEEHRWDIPLGSIAAGIYTLMVRSDIGIRTQLLEIIR